MTLLKPVQKSCVFIRDEGECFLFKFNGPDTKIDIALSEEVAGLMLLRVSEYA